MRQDLFNSLNEKQQEAVKAFEGPSIILAGAGSGKTRVLVHKVLNLIINHDVNPKQIAMITFTNKAAGEMKTRIEKALPEYGHPHMALGYVGTFHSLCARILRIEAPHLGISRNFSIYDESDTLSLIKTIVKGENIKKFTPYYFINRISSAKNEMISANKYEEVFSDWGAKEIARIYKKYQEKLKENQALDFDDLLVKAIELFTINSEVLEKYQHMYKYLLVDEFQDTNLAQYMLTRMLGRLFKNVTVVGDFSQSIYSWRGADIRNLERFKEDFPKTQTFHLERNYRSSQYILDFAYEIISKNQSHPILHLYTDNDRGEEVIFHEAQDEEQEAFFAIGEIERLAKIHPNYQFALLYRTNAQSRVIEEALLHWGIPYMLIGGTRFYERREVKDVLSYLRLLVNPTDTVATDRIKKLGKKRWEDFKSFYQEVSKKVDDRSTTELMEQLFEATRYLEFYDASDEEDFQRLENIKELKSVAQEHPRLVGFLEQVALVESEYFEREKNKQEVHVKLMTLHQAKGAEFEVVFVMGLEDGLLPHSRSINDYFQLEEERRLFYVGITRAKKRLYITNARRRFIFGSRGYSLKSRFIADSEAVF